MLLLLFIIEGFSYMLNIMSEKRFVLGLISAVMFYSIVSCANKTERKQPEVTVELSKDSVIARGEYLVSSIGCGDCHSPKRMGPKGPEAIPELILSGYPANRPIPQFSGEEIKKGHVVVNADLTAAMGPWGTSFAGNLTPDPTGIGSWTENQFKIAMKRGKYKGIENARPLMPPMPWQNFANLTDGDLHSIFTYLQSIKPVVNVVPALIPNEVSAKL